ncbi:hypothetical protein D3C76_1259680 [compost metagenome]
MFQFVGEFDDQDRVFAGQPHQHHEADLGEQVVVATGQPYAGDRRQNAHGHDQQYRKRQAQALVLRGEHEEHQQHRQRQDDDQGVAGHLVLVGDLGPFVADAARQGPFGDTLHRLQGLAAAVARRWRATDVGGGEAVVAHGLVGAVALS